MTSRHSQPSIVWIVLVGAPCGLLAGLAAAFISAVSPLLALTLTLALAGLALAVARPLWVLYLAIVTVPLEAVSQQTGVGVSLTPSKLLMIAAVGGWITRRILTGEPIRIAPSLSGPALLLVVSIIPGLLIAQDRSLVVKQLGLWSLFFGAFVMVSTEGDEHLVRHVLIALSLSGGLVGLLGIFRFEHGVGGARAIGPFTQPDTLGAFLALAIPAQLVMVLHVTRFKRLGLAACLVASLLGMALSVSRGAWIGLASAIAFMLLWRPFRRVFLIAVGPITVVLVAGLILAPGVFDPHGAIKRVGALGNGSSAPISLRTQVYRTAPRIFLDHPLFGVGAVQFPAVAPEYGLTDPAFTEPKFGNPHDIYLHIATTLGTLGLLALVWLGISLVRALTVSCRRLRGQLHAESFALAGAFVAMALTGVTNDFVNSDPIVGILFVLMACGSVLSGIASTEHRPAVRV